jgi:hypothetical protein
MLPSTRTLALLVGFAAPVAGFGTITDGGLTIGAESSSQYWPPDLKYCDMPDDKPSSQCFPQDVFAKELCAGIGTTVTVLGASEWCASDKSVTRDKCRSGLRVKASTNKPAIQTSDGPGRIFDICHWDDEAGKCKLASYSIMCLDNSAPVMGCADIKPVEDGIEERQPQAPEAGPTRNTVLANRCSDKYLPSTSYFDTNGNPKWTRAYSCTQRLLDCTLSGGRWTTGCGSGWDRCCEGPNRLRHRELQDQPPEATREPRKLADGCPAGTVMKPMTTADGDPSGFCCTAGAVSSEPITGVWKEKGGLVDAKITMETCDYQGGEGVDDTCTCTTEVQPAGSSSNCPTVMEKLKFWG